MAEVRSEDFSGGSFLRIVNVGYFKYKGGKKGQKRVNVTEIEFEEMWRSFRATLAIDFLFFSFLPSFPQWEMISPESLCSSS